MLLYVDDERLAKAACRLGLASSAAAPLEVAQRLAADGCAVSYAVLERGAGPLDVVEAKRLGARGVLVLGGDARVCTMAEALGLSCSTAVVVDSRELARAGAAPRGRTVLVRPSCPPLLRLLGGPERCVRSAYSAVAGAER